MTVKIAINGLGRIGRCLLRAYRAHPADFEVVAVNAPSGAEMSAHLLKYDSTHGVFAEQVCAAGDYLQVGDRRIRHLAERDLDKLQWEDAPDVVMECSGLLTTRAAAAAHLQKGAKKTLVSAPTKNADATIVYGVNHHTLEADAADATVVSCGSCTTNCLAPVAAVLDACAGIDSGWMSTVHAFTNDQRLLDGRHKDLRRARAATASIIPTKTGAADAIGLVLPQLAGKLSGIALRVPTPNVSLVDLTCLMTKPMSAEDINAAFAEAAAGAMRGVLAVNTEPLVSVDFKGHPASSIVDAPQTKVVNRNLVKVLSWYDNEWGFACRMLDVAALMAR